MTANDAVTYLVEHGFVASNRAGKLIFTKRYYEQLGLPAEGAVTAIAVKERNLTLLPGQADWESYYMNFILACDIPKEGRDSQGGIYTMNAYSKEGMEAFRKAIQSGIKYEGLVACTKLYYKSKVTMKVAIGKYIASGAWRTDYLMLGKAIQENKVEQHIKETTATDGKRTSYRIG